MALMTSLILAMVLPLALFISLPEIFNTVEPFALLIVLPSLSTFPTVEPLALLTVLPSLSIFPTVEPL